MCLKYFVGYSTCDHHEYLGGHHCSLRPCDLDTQHFHYIEDDFPVPWPEDTLSERSVLACNMCVAEQRDKHDPEEAPVQPYAPTNDFQVKEIQRTGSVLPIQVVRAEEDATTTGKTETEDSGDSFDYDYKSLSDADDDEWNERKNTYQSTGYDKAHDEVLVERHRNHLQSQLRYLPNYLMQQRQFLPFAPPELIPEAYAMENYLHYPIPHISYLAPPPVLSIPPWHEGMASLSSVPSKTRPTRPDDSPPQLLPVLIPHDADKRVTPASLPQRPVTPPLTPPLHLLPPRPTPPYLVGSMTDAYLRIEAAKRRHIRERARRQRSSLRDALPARSMALTDFMVKKRSQGGRYKEVNGLEDMEMDTWPSLPFASEDKNTECGAEEHTERIGSEEVAGRFSCRLVTLM